MYENSERANTENVAYNPMTQSLKKSQLKSIKNSGIWRSSEKREEYVCIREK